MEAAIDGLLRLEERDSVDISPELLRQVAGQAPHLAERLSSRGVRRQDRALTAFLETLLVQPEQLQLVAGHAVLTDWMLQVFELSPYLADQLTRYPDLLEEIRAS